MIERFVVKHISGQSSHCEPFSYYYNLKKKKAVWTRLGFGCSTLSVQWEKVLRTFIIPVLFRVLIKYALVFSTDSESFLSLLQCGSGRRILWQQRDQRRCLPADLFTVQRKPHAGRSGESGRWLCRVRLSHLQSGNCLLGFNWFDKLTCNLAIRSLKSLVQNNFRHFLPSSSFFLLCKRKACFEMLRPKMAAGRIVLWMYLWEVCWALTNIKITNRAKFLAMDEYN